MNTTSAAPGSGSDTLQLQISDPVSLLNEIANRYPSVERILMEYVDNALDDAEGVYRANGELYPVPVRIDIIIDPAARRITTRDNCRGMTKQTLTRVVQRVGESQKKGITWVNGRFGFGVHAFRAAAEAITFKTKHRDGEHLELHLRRDQERGIRAPWPLPEPFPTDTGTGTEVTVGPFERDWFDGVSVDSIKHEIETHFERLLARQNLTITVSDGTTTAVCKPFDYAQIPGEDFHRTLEIEVGSRLHEVEVYLKVASLEVAGRNARFFARGRRINEVAEIKSFIRSSAQRTSVWGHPHLLGYIEVGEIAKPAISRDDFDRGAGRKALYEAVLALEPEIADALHRVNTAHRDDTFTQLEDVLRDVLNDLAREDRLRLRSGLVAGNETGVATPGTNSEPTPKHDPAPEEPHEPHPKPDTPPTPPDNPPEPPSQPSTPAPPSESDVTTVAEDPRHAQGEYRRRTGLDIKFADFPPDLDGKMKRSRLVDGVIYINVSHQDFTDRMTYSRQGQPRFTDRMAAYLAATVSIHYKDQFYLRYGRQPERRDQMFDEQVDFMCRIESALRPHLPALQARIGNGNGDEAHA